MDCNENPSPVRVVCRWGARGQEAPAVSIPLDFGLFGAGLLLALVMGAFGLEAAAAQPGSDALGRALAWGAFGAAVAGGALGLLPRLRHARPGRFATAAVATACAATLPLLWLAGNASVDPWVAGAAGGAAWCLAGVAWLRRYAGREPWVVALHVSGSLMLGGLLYLLGFPWADEAPAASPYLTALAAAACVALFAQGAGTRPGRPVPGTCVCNGEEDPGRAPTTDTGAGGTPTEEGTSLAQALLAFAKTQWVPLAGVALIAFVHGLRWRSGVLGFSAARPYTLGGFEYLLGPLLAVACAWAVFRRRSGVPPQRTACQILVPVAAAVLLVVPVLNPLRGFYAAVDTASPPWTVLEMGLDVLNEGAVSLLILSAVLSVATAPRTTGVTARLAGCVLAACAAGGFLLGAHGYMAVGINGTIVCFLAWTVYLLAAGLASIGKDRGAREGERLVRESMDNFIRRASRGLAQTYGLSQREENILRYLARGYSYTYTAQDFCISENTVRTHAKHIYAKLGIAKREELFALLDAQGATG